MAVPAQSAVGGAPLWVRVQRKYAAEVARLAGNAQTETLLATSIEQISQTRSIFMGDAKQLVTLILTLFVGAGALASFAVGSDQFQESLVFFAVAIAVLAFVFPVSSAVLAKARAGYELYVSAVLHAALLHEAAGLRGAHHWFDHVHRAIREIRDGEDRKVVGFELDRDWRHLIVESWKKSSSANSGNLFQSFQVLVIWAKVAAGLGLLLGSLLAGFHWRSGSRTLAGPVSPELGLQGEASPVAPAAGWRLEGTLEFSKSLAFTVPAGKRLKIDSIYVGRSDRAFPRIRYRTAGSPTPVGPALLFEGSGPPWEYHRRPDLVLEAGEAVELFGIETPGERAYVQLTGRLTDV